MKVWLVRLYRMYEGYSNDCRLFKNKFDAYMFIVNELKKLFSITTNPECLEGKKEIFRDLAEKYKEDNTKFESMSIGFAYWTAVLLDVN